MDDSTTAIARKRRSTVWADQDRHDVRPYALTGGRTRPRHAMRLDSLLVADDAAPRGLAPEARQAVELCHRRPVAVAEIAARIGHSALVAMIILSDAIDAAALRIVPSAAAPATPSIATLQAVVAGLQNLPGNVT